MGYINPESTVCFQLQILAEAKEGSQLHTRATSSVTVDTVFITFPCLSLCLPLIRWLTQLPQQSQTQHPDTDAAPLILLQRVNSVGTGTTSADFHWEFTTQQSHSWDPRMVYGLPCTKRTGSVRQNARERNVFYPPPFPDLSFLSLHILHLCGRGWPLWLRAGLLHSSYIMG